jgi:hypothetical protein
MPFSMPVTAKKKVRTAVTYRGPLWAKRHRETKSKLSLARTVRCDNFVW